MPTRNVHDGIYEKLEPKKKPNPIQDLILDLGLLGILFSVIGFATYMIYVTVLRG